MTTTDGIVHDWKIEPVCIGPTWQRNPDWDGLDPLSEFVLPELTLGWQILDWIRDNLLAEDTDQWGNPQPFRPTDEQARFILWWYALDDEGRFTYRDGVLQRLKGWGKDPLIAVICAVEFLGPCRFGGWLLVDRPDLNLVAGDPIGIECKNAWIDIAAVSKEQTRNTMSLFPALFNDECKKRHFMNKQSIGKEIIYAHRGQRIIRAVTSSPKTLEGGRATFVVRNETHHWLEANNGHEMAAVIERNATKSKGGAARALSITNAYDPGQNSVAQQQREAWEDEQSGLAFDTGVLYDSLEIPEEWGLRPPELKSGIEGLTPEDEEIMVRAYLGRIIEVVRGDSWWLNQERITNSVLDRNNPPSRSRRFWFNQIVAAEDAWVLPAAVEAAIDPIAASERRASSSGNAGDILRAGWIVSPADPIVVFGDGSKSDDATGLIGCRLSDGYCFTLGVWQRPADLPPKQKWLVPRGEVDARVGEIFERFNVAAFWFDPSHTQDDDNTRYWDGYIDDWHRRYGDRLNPDFWAVKSGLAKHSIMWDMASPERHKLFVGSAETTLTELEHQRAEGEFAPTFTIDGHPALVQHLKNAYRHPVTLPGGATGVSIRKANRESRKKIDLAACLIGARLLRRLILNVGADEQDEAPKSGMAFAL